MSRLADPAICPDCRADLDLASTCTGCGLPLAGEPGERLWQTMLGADRQVEQIRRAAGLSGQAPSRQDFVLPQGPAASRAPEEARQHGPRAPEEARQHGPRVPEEARQHGLRVPEEARQRRLEGRPRRLPALSVPVVLLSLGGLCLLIAAVVFVALTWSVLGLTGRTLVLGGVTGLVGAGAVLVTRRRLRGAAETLWVVGSGLLALNLLAGRAAGLPGLADLGTRGLPLAVGSVLFVLGVAVADWSRRTTTAALTAPQGVAVLGALVATAGGAWLAPGSAVGTTIAVPVLVLLGVVLRDRLVAVSVAVLAITGLSWLVLAGIGLDRADEQVAWSTWWSDLRGWQLLVAGVYAAGAAVGLPRLRRGDESTVVALAAAALAPLCVLANAPGLAEATTRGVVVGALTIVALAGATRLAPRSWALAAATLGLLGSVAAVLRMTHLALAVTTALPSTASARLVLPPANLPVAAWAWPVSAAAVALLLHAAERAVPAAHASLARQLGIVLGTATLTLGALAALLDTRPELWLAALGATAGSAVVAVPVWSRRMAWSTGAIGIGSAAAGAFALLGLGTSLPSASLTAGIGGAMALVLATAFAVAEHRHARKGVAVAPVLTGGLAVLTGTLALTAAGTASAWSSATTALVVAVFAAVLLLVAAPVSRRASSRLALELTAIAPAVVAAAAAPDLTSLAMILTVLGTAIALDAVLNVDRQHAGWVATVLLGGATLLRVMLEVRAPEVYTLPAAALLLAAGGWRLHRDPTSDSLGAVGSGLVLALVPSLLLALQDPLTLRGVLVAAAGLLVLAVGVRRHLSAPFVAGAGTLALLAVRQLGPVSDVLPRWLALAVVGVSLLAVGITWESRLRNLRSAGDYLTALR